jgi:drug/metabolite transporter (DMT)-like permease
MANFSFALGSQFFTHFTRIYSSTWMNTFKALAAGIAFFITILITTGFNPITNMGFIIFLISGAIGLGIGDIFLLKAFAEIGPGRTMVIFGFHPIIVGIFSYFVFAQEVETHKLWGIFFFIICLLIFSLESFRATRQWKLNGLMFAFAGMALDASGVLLTRFAFDTNKMTTPLEGNFYRCIGAIIVYIIIRRFSPFHFRARLKSMSKKSLLFLVMGAFFGTYLSLMLYLQAIQIAESLALISSISITAVIFSSTFECIWEKKAPSGYLLLAFVFFLIGTYFTLG